MSASAVLKLQKVGFSIEQVEALADFMDTQAASKADLEAAGHRLEMKIAEVRTDASETKAELKAENAEIRSDLAAVEHRLDRKITEAKAELKAEIAEAKVELKAEIAEVKSDLKLIRADVRQSEQRMVIKLGGLMVIAVGVLLAALRYLPPPHL